MSNKPSAFAPSFNPGPQAREKAQTAIESYAAKVSKKIMRPVVLSEKKTLEKKLAGTAAHSNSKVSKNSKLSKSASPSFKVTVSTKPPAPVKKVILHPYGSNGSANKHVQIALPARGSDRALKSVNNPSLTSPSSPVQGTNLSYAQVARGESSPMLTPKPDFSSDSEDTMDRIIDAPSKPTTAKKHSSPFPFLVDSSSRAQHEEAHSPQ
jgi:hypothetical protein